MHWTVACPGLASLRKVDFPTPDQRIAAYRTPHIFSPVLASLRRCPAVINRLALAMQPQHRDSLFAGAHLHVTH